MIIEEITLKNFRCFLGEQKITLSNDENHRLTIVHAQNGSGKTNLLNCVMWTFFGKFTAGFDQKSNIANDEYRDSGGTDAWVEVVFKFNKTTYRARRFFDATKPPKEQSSNFKMWKLLKNGHSDPEPHPESLIETIMPQSMAEYFFFDGEVALSIAQAENSSEISRAIKNILGCNIAETALEDLKTVEKKYRDTLSGSYTSSELTELNEKLDGTISSIDALTSQLASADAQIELQQTRIKDIRTQLLRREETANIQKQIQSNERQETRSSQRLNNANDKLAKWPDTNAVPLVSKKLIRDVTSILESQKIEHKIPDKYQKPVIEQLIKDQRCICGTEFEIGSPQHACIEALLENSADSAQLERFSNVQATLVKLRENQSKSKHELVSIMEEQSICEADIADAQQRLKQLNKDFKSVDNEELQEFKRKEEAANKELIQFMTNMSRAKVDLEDLQRNEREIRKAINDAEKKSQLNSKHAFKRDRVVQLQQEIQRQLDEHIESAISVITATVNNVLKKISAQEMRFSLSKDFNISVKLSGKKRPLSKGQQQLVGLVFLGALVQFCKIRRTSQTNLLLPGTTAPLILDAPFSHLDNEYMPDVAKVLPEMAEQMILMLSGSHSTPEVMKNFKPYIGKEYVVIRHNRMEKTAESKDWAITLKGKKYVRNLFSRDSDSSYIEEVV